MTTPSLGRIVRYRGRHGLQAERAAIITATVGSLDPRGVTTGQVRGLDSPEHVHLWVFTPGGPGFPEDNVPLCPAGLPLRPGMWAWPPRV